MFYIFSHVSLGKHFVPEYNYFTRVLFDLNDVMYIVIFYVEFC